MLNQAASKPNEHSHPSVLWWFSGVLLLIVAVACGTTVSAVGSALAFTLGASEPQVVFIAIATLLVGFGAGLIVGWRDLASLAAQNVAQLPLRWIPGSLAAMFVAAPFWSLCVVQYQERITSSGAVRLGFDEVEYVLAGSLFLPLAIGVPLILHRIRRRAR
jgi:hypothetical protein